jgi:glycosyltransferase A (GT-A) superfamily protein (DUF2064 family)
MTVTLAVICKEPLPGKVKTRLCPPCTFEQAARIAEAAIVDTLQAVAATAAPRKVCVLDGAPGPWLPNDFDVIPQRRGGLDARLAGAFADIGGPLFLIGMDTPQISPALLEEASDRLLATDAVLGYTHDGGYWGIGLHHPQDEVFIGVPMSQHHTGHAQRARLHECGLALDDQLPWLTDVDDVDAANHVAATAPGSRFARALRSETIPVPAFPGTAR